MIRVFITGGSAIALIFFVAFVASRLMRARSQGTSIRMQFFLALASTVGAFALGLGLLVLDRLEARTTLITEARRPRGPGHRRLRREQIDVRGAGLEDVGRKYAAAHTGRPDPAERGLALLDPAGRAVFSGGLSPSARNTVSGTAPILVRGSRSAACASSSRPSSSAARWRTWRRSSWW